MEWKEMRRQLPKVLEPFEHLFNLLIFLYEDVHEKLDKFESNGTHTSFKMFWSRDQLKDTYRVCGRVSLLTLNSQFLLGNTVTWLPRWLSGEEFPAKTGDMDLIPGSDRFSGEGHGNPLQYSCLGNPMDRGAWRATVHGVQGDGHNLVTKQQQKTMVIYFIPGGLVLGPEKNFGKELGLIICIQSFCPWRSGWSLNVSGSLAGSVSIFMICPNVNSGLCELKIQQADLI